MGGRWLGVVALLVLGGVATGCAADGADGDASASAITTAGAQGVRDLQAAMDRRDTDREALARQLAQVTYALTDDQKQAYVKAFAALPETTATNQAFERAAASLDTELRRTLADPALLARSADGALYDAFVLLAKTRYAATSLRFAAHLLGDDPAYARLARDKSEVLRDLVAESLPTALASLLVTTGSKDSALTQLEALLESAHGGGDAIVSALEGYRTITGAYDHAPDLRKIEDTRVGQALHAVGALLAIWEVGNGVNAAAHGDAREALEHFVTGGPDAVAALAEGVGALRRVFQGIEETALATRVVAIAGKVSAALTVVTSVLATDLKQWNAGADAKIRVLGDLVAIGAGIATLAGFAAGGFVFGAVALGVTLVADLLRDERLARLDRDQKLRILPAVFPRDAALARTIAMADVGALGRLHDDLELAPPDIQRIARVYPEGLTGERFGFLPTQWIGLGITKDIFTLDGARIAGLVETVAGTTGTEAQRSYRAHFFAGYLSNIPGYAGLSRPDALAWLTAQGTSETAQTLVAGSAIDLATWKRMLADAVAYLK